MAVAHGLAGGRSDPALLSCFGWVDATGAVTGTRPTACFILSGVTALAAAGFFGALVGVRRLRQRRAAQIRFVCA